MFVSVGAKAGVRNVTTGSQAVNCFMKVLHSLLSGWCVSHQGSGRVSQGLWCVGQDPHLAGDHQRTRDWMWACRAGTPTGDQLRRDMYLLTAAQNNLARKPGPARSSFPEVCSLQATR